MLCNFLTSDDPNAQRYGAATLARSTRTQASKKTVADVGGTKRLLDLLRVRVSGVVASCCALLACLTVACLGRSTRALQTTNHATVVRDCMHALLNLTTEKKCQLIVGRLGVDTLVEFARASDKPDIQASSHVATRALRAALG